MTNTYERKILFHQHNFPASIFTCIFRMWEKEQIEVTSFKIKFSQINLQIKVFRNDKMISDELETILIVILLFLVIMFWVGVSYVIRFPIILDYRGDTYYYYENKAKSTTKLVSATDATSSKDQLSPTLVWKFL